MTAAAAAVKPKDSNPTVQPLLEPNRNYSIPDAAAAVGCAAITVWRAIYARRLETYRMGRLRRVSGAQLQTWLESGGKTA